MKKLYLLLASLPVFVTACAQGGKDIPNKTLGDSVFTKGDVIRIPAVLYDLGKATLRPESHVSLDHVVLFMQKHPGLVLEVQNHFDTRVNPNSSIRLTQVRAQSCLEYLVSQGIPKDRLIAKGYHCYQPIVTDIEIGKLKTVEEKEAAHQKNRRTQLKILRMDYAHTGASKSSRPKPDSISGKKVQVIIPVPDTAYYKYGFKVFTDTADWRLWESAVIKPIFSNAGARGPKDDARLDTIAAYLKNHPGLVIEIGSHIDSRGSDVFNLKLSTARAQSVASYLINKGAAPKQLIAKGYGETRLLIADSEINKLKTIVEKERAHGINRRIEITVRRPDFGRM
jgi:outer membrane protein OmpA-like peptidoglycan-associated protein